MTYQTFYPEQRIEFYSLNDASVFPGNTAYSENSIRMHDKKFYKGTNLTLQKFRSRRRLFDTPSLVESNSSEFDHNFDIEKQSEEEVRETMTEIMEQYMSKTRENYGSGVTSGLEHEDANEHIEKVLEIVDLFHIPKVTQDQIMLQAFLVSLTRAASRWLRNQPSGSITTWEVLKTKFLNKYCPPTCTAKNIKEINNFQQEADESLFHAWERFIELLMMCPYLTDMQEVILFYNGLDVPTRQILDSKGAIPSKTIADAKIAIQEMAEYSQKWHNGTSSRTRSDGVDTQSKVPDEQQQKVTGTNEGAGVTPEVPDVPKYDSESEEESWTFSQDDKDAKEESDRNDDSKETESDNDEDDLTYPNLSTYKADEDEEEEEEKADDEEDDDKDKEAEQEEEEEEDDDDLYRDLNINLERSNAEMTDAQANQDMEDTHVTLTTMPPVVQQQISSISPDLVLKFFNPSSDIGIDLILNQDTQSDTIVNVPVLVAAETPSSVTIIPQPPIPNSKPLQQTPTSTTTKTNLKMTLLEIPNFASLFQFDQRVSALEFEMSEFRQTSQFTETVSLIPGIIDTYLASKMKEAVDVVVQLQTNKLKEEA
ncbi:retrovirus-related pol polyprotein from transposon TNT 1-94 [Tanacetum coccineum]